MKRAFALLELVVVTTIVLILAAILFPVFASHCPNVSRRVQCQVNLKQIGLGFLMYAQDYNNVFPASATGTSSGWADAVQPYVRSWSLFQCPSTQNQAAASTDYFFNARLSRGYTNSLSSPSQIILLGEGNDDAPTRTKLRQLPARWLTDKTTPAWRHLGIGNYLFTDGHTKSLKTNAVSVQSPDKTMFTFAVR